jgi:hypothetical protein
MVLHCLLLKYLLSSGVRVPLEVSLVTSSHSLKGVQTSPLVHFANSEIETFHSFHF